MKKGWKIAIGGGILVLVIGMGIIIKSVASIADGISSMPVTVANVKTQKLEDKVKLTGSIVSEEKMIVIAKASGRIGDVQVEVGQQVKKGEVLASYSLSDAEKAMKQATLQQDKITNSYEKTMAGNSKSSAKKSEADTNLEVLEQQITDWESYIENLQNSLSKYRTNTSNDLYQQNFNLSKKAESLAGELASLNPNSDEYIEKSKELNAVKEQLSKVQYQQQTTETSDYVTDTQNKIAQAQKELAQFKEYEAEMKGQKNSSEAQILDSYDKESLKIDSELAEMTYESAKEDYENVVQGIVADCDGIITSCSVVDGAIVTAGMQVMTLESDKKIMVECTASQSDWEKLSVGQAVEVTFGSRNYTGKISNISRIASPDAKGNVGVTVQIRIENPDDNLVLGFSAKANILTRTAENAMVIPVEAIYSDRDGDYVYVVKDGKVEKHNVKCGMSTGLEMEVLEGVGLSDQVVIKSFTDLEDGMEVTTVTEE